MKITVKCNNCEHVERHQLPENPITVLVEMNPLITGGLLTQWRIKGEHFWWVTVLD